MNLQKSQDRINELMSRFVAQVKGAKAMRRTDINRVSEDVLIPLFAEVYGHTDLRNLNVSEGPNFPAIDLGDEKTRTAYQITSRFRSEKIKDTIKKFVDHKLYEKFDRLVIYILTEKPKTYRGKGLDQIIQGKFAFAKDTDILDYQDLLKEISGFCLEKTYRIEKILQQHFAEESKLNNELISILDWLAQVNDLWNDESTTIKINREKLLSDLQEFVLQGNGVIIGGPGVGKSYLFKELHHSLDSSSTPHLLLHIDKLGDGTQETLWQELSYEGDLIKKLKSVPTSCQKSILLFDAFDAARDEQTRKRFLNLIRRAIHTLKDSWNVVVTVRTYDAMKSQELLDLFGTPDDTEYQSKDILCRHLTIPPLNEDEIQQAFDQIPHLECLYQSGSEDFKRLLANPFNLWLLQRILKTPQDVQHLSQIHSEVQLLGQFWQRKVENANNGDHRWSLLNSIAHRMVESRSLTIRRAEVCEHLDLDKPARQIAWTKLQSDGILARVSSTGIRIAFSHNIFFDYAISALLIEDDPQQLENFVLEDLSRPLFLRPSLTYFFTRLWYVETSESFWKAFWHVFSSNQSVHLRLVARLIPTSVIANEAREIGQLTPLLDKLEQGEGVANEAMAWLLQSLRALQIRRDLLWSDFFEQVSEHPDSKFAWDLAILSSDVLERAKIADNKVVINACGRIARRLFRWIWQRRGTGENDWHNRLGASWALPLVVRTYGTNVEKSRLLLEKILELTQEDNFSIDFLTSLTEHVDKIWGHDPELVALIYCATFAHDETSDEKTNSIGTPVLPLTSTRRQDYDMCQYRLVKHSPDFLRTAPLIAAPAIIQNLNYIIRKEYIVGYLKESAEHGESMNTFNFRGKPVYYIEDNSCIWDEQEHRDEPLEMADVLFEFIVGLAESKNLAVDSMLDVFRDEVRFAYFWKRLLKTAARFPKVFAPRLFELCIAKPILMGSDTLFEIGLFLKAVVSAYTPEQRFQIEETILNLAAGDRRNLLLAQIPPSLLLTPGARKIREEMERENSVPENRPLVTFGPVTWSDYTEEERLQDQGVDTTTPENQELQRLFGPLDKFHSDWLNESPTEKATESILPLLREAHVAVESETKADKKIIDRLWLKLTACVAILGRVVDDSEILRFVFCRDVLLEAAKHELPKPDAEGDSEFNYPGYCPCPRHEAAQGLLRLSAHKSEPELLDSIESLARDPVPSVRMVTMRKLYQVYDTNPERFWHIIELRATNEANLVVQKYIYTPLTYIVSRKEENEDRTTRVMDKLLRRAGPPTGGFEPSDPFILLLMWLAINRENSWALKTIEDTFFKDPIQFANALDHAVFQVMKDNVVPKNLETDDGRETATRAIVWLGKVITVASGGIKELCAIPHEERTEETNKTLRDTYTVIEKVIMRLYFEVVHQKDRSEEPSEKIPRELRCRFYIEVKPLMKQVIFFAADQETGLMFAPTAYRFMRLLTSFLSCNPTEVLHLAAGLARSSERFGYNLDALAVQDVVKFVGIVLADHRSEVREGQALEDLLNLLDIFAKAGWSEALRLVWRLDEVFR